MPVSALLGSASLTPAFTARVHGPNPRQTVTAAPFTPQAQAQANAINTGRDPNRGNILDIHVPSGSSLPPGANANTLRIESQLPAQQQKRVAAVNIQQNINRSRGALIDMLA